MAVLGTAKARGVTVAKGGSQHACPVGVSKIRARSSVESLLNRPLAEILSSTEPADFLAKDESRRLNPPRSMSRHVSAASPKGASRARDGSLMQRDALNIYDGILKLKKMVLQRRAA